MSDPWVLLKRGEHREAFSEFERLRDEKPTPSRIFSFGVAMIWAEQYRDAYQYFSKIIEEEPQYSGRDYGMAGVAAWNDARFSEAVDLWRSGLNCRYGDGARNLTPALLLYFAGVHEAKLVSLREVKKVIREKVSKVAAHVWPAPIGLHVLGELSASEASAAIPFVTEDALAASLWVTRFWSAVIAREQGDAANYEKEMSELAAMEGREYAEEFYLARWESQRRVGDR